MGNVKIVGRVVIVTGPVSTGKSSLCRKMVERYKGTCRVITMKRANPQIAATIDDVLKANELIREGIMSKRFVIVKTQNMSYEAIVSLIACVRVMGYKDKITLIKLNLSEELHIDYWRRNRKQSKISLKKLKKERKDFNKIVEASDFIDANIICVEINDPEDIAFEFYA